MRSTPIREHQLLIVVSSAHPHSALPRFTSNRMLYNSVMARAPHFATMNLGRDEARYWHKRIYSGLVRISFFSKPCAPDAHMYALKTPLTQVLPSDIGAAAAYEAYRTWKHNSFLYEPLGANRQAQREGLIGMAIGEGASALLRVRPL